MNKIIDYIVVCNDDSDEFKKEIIELSLEGYVLVGGVSASYNQDKHLEGDWLYQAMVKYESDNADNRAA